MLTGDHHANVRAQTNAAIDLVCITGLSYPTRKRAKGESEEHSPGEAKRILRLDRENVRHYCCWERQSR